MSSSVCIIYLPTDDLNTDMNRRTRTNTAGETRVNLFKPQKQEPVLSKQSRQYLPFRHKDRPTKGHCRILGMKHLPLQRGVSLIVHDLKGVI